MFTRRRVSIGLVTVAVVGLLLAMALEKARRATDEWSCETQLHNIALCCIMYSNGNRETRFPDSVVSLVTTQQMLPEGFVRPDSGDTPPPGKTFDEKISHLMDGGHEPYVYVGKTLTGKSPADAVVFYEPVSDDGYGGHVAFADGHVELFSAANLQKIIAMDKSGLRPIYWPPHPATRPGIAAVASAAAEQRAVNAKKLNRGGARMNADGKRRIHVLIRSYPRSSV